MVKFTYLPTGEIVRVVDTFNSLNEPTKPIHLKQRSYTASPTKWSPVTRSTTTRLIDLRLTLWLLSPITQHSIDGLLRGIGALSSTRRGACSVNNIDWRQHGFEGFRLRYLLAGVGTSGPPRSKRLPSSSRDFGYWLAVHRADGITIVARECAQENC
jgi:DNA polymerase-3 subunit epsilon